MQTFVLLEHKPEGCYIATLLGWPDCTAQAATENEALARLRQVVRERLAHAKIVPFEVELPQIGNPLLQVAGAFKDNPLLDEVAEEIAAYRRELDAMEERLV